MARTRKPTATLEASGAFEKNPQRRAARSGEPKGIPGVGEPPEGLEGEQKTIWRELASTIAPGVLEQSDRSAFEEFVLLKYGSRHNRLNVGEKGLLLTYHSKFGLTPSDRSKVHVGHDSTEDPLEAFLSEKYFDNGDETM
jgi:hypothetical protein